MNLRRTLSRAPTFASISLEYRKTIGHKFRDLIATCDKSISPIKKYIFPNFIAVHYFYILMLTILTSIMIYPVGGHKYIDILFLSTGATTQGGLNTVDVNSLSLYQQMILYISCTFATPIFIHGFLAFVRLYWFERYFDDIKATSKRDFRLRRTKTILERELTARTMSQNRNRTFSKFGTRTLTRGRSGNSRSEDFQEKLFSGEMVNRDEFQTRDKYHENEENEHIHIRSRNPGGIVFEENHPIRRNRRTGEQFEGRRNSTEITPADMYRSIQMMQNQHHDNDEEDGPALVIKSPTENNRFNNSDISLNRVHSVVYEDSGSTADNIREGSEEDEEQEEDNSEDMSSNENEEEMDDISIVSELSIPRRSFDSNNHLYNDADADADISFSTNTFEASSLVHLADESDNTNQSSRHFLVNNNHDISDDDADEEEEDDDEEEGDGDDNEEEDNIGDELSNEEISKTLNNTSGEEEGALADEDVTIGGYTSGSIQSILSRGLEPLSNYSRNDSLGDAHSNISSINFGSESNSYTNSTNIPSSSITSSEHSKDQASQLDAGPAVTFASNVARPNRRNIEQYTPTAIRNNGPSIQFDVSEPPSTRRRRLSSRNHATDAYISPTRGKHKKKSSKGLFKRIPKGGKIQRRLKKRFTNNSFETPSHIKKSKHTSMSENNGRLHSNTDDMDEYFADNESDENIPHRAEQDYSYSTDAEDEEYDFFSGLQQSQSFDFDNVNSDLSYLAKKRDFQDAVYKNWKAGHKGKNKFSRNWNPSERAQFLHPIRTMTQEFGLNQEQDYDTHGKQNYRRARRPTSVRTQSNTDDDFNFPSRRMSIADTEQGDYTLHFDHDFNLAHPNRALRRRKSYLSYTPTIGRNSTFAGLNKSQRNELGGVEYRAIKLLCIIIAVYYFGFHVCSFVMLVPWISLKPHYKKIVREDGVSPAWWGFFTAMSAFNDLGLTLTPDSMSSFNSAIYPLLVMAWFIIIGNTGFPILLRFIIWILKIFSPDLSQMQESLQFLLDHPRRCFTLLFPSGATWWLTIILVGMNLTDLILFIILDFESNIIKPYSTGTRTLIGFFQGVSTRTAGFSVTDIRHLHPAIQVGYMLMMYISVMPVAISLRRTNVYEEQSLGIYGQGEPDTSDDEGTEEDSEEESDDNNEEEDDDEDDDDEEEEEEEEEEEYEEYDNLSRASSQRTKRKKKKALRKAKKRKRAKEKKAASHIGTHIMMQLSFDLWFLFLGLFIICLCEGGKLKDSTKPDFDIFSVLFEIVSAYGTVGLSLGYPNTNQSFSAQFTTLSKLIIIALLIRGRHRGLPNSVDRAIILPSERMEHNDHVAAMKLQRKGRTESTTDPITLSLRKRVTQLSTGFKNVKGIFPAFNAKEKSPVSDVELQDYNNYNQYDEDQLITEQQQDKRSRKRSRPINADEEDSGSNSLWGNNPNYFTTATNSIDFKPQHWTHSHNGLNNIESPYNSYQSESPRHLE
ncbi:hypothetical protein TBLA_0B07820 [Henningerozyma blattae CBS 6284]|uniref:Potassium transport protein n=1 Tax=Henningerozyma blattae (strain ATCC 34711 / CBS 6284 / DSM 70876 / NBRC 10599 / NRRL Y-10934 / UCD 77-7) TaxID=1071380 RepID=I2GZP6_HENB6|nr:hypothetical protein TBLA_0B07820 [Tetrapisispora blattae CBS 6284]CCH59598.1 hypothetical protein TBLA_0B07820 [Tetrapisispora blattae CBS 6284]